MMRSGRSQWTRPSSESGPGASRFDPSYDPRRACPHGAATPGAWMRETTSPRSSRVRTLLLVCAVLVSVLAAPVRTQTEQAAGQALTDFLAATAQPESERLVAARALSGHAEPAVTRALLEALGGATLDAYRVALIDAMCAMSREGVVEPLCELLSAPATTPTTRSAAARGLAKQGSRACERLRDIALASGSGVALARTYAVMGLGQANEDHAWRMLAAVAKDGGLVERRSAVRYLERAPDLAEVRAALEECAGDADVLLAVVATRLVVESKVPGARSLVLGLLKRVEGSTASYSRSDLLRAIVAVFDDAFFDAFLVAAGASDLATRKALDEALPTVAANPAFVAWLRKNASKRKSTVERGVAIRILGGVAGVEITRELVAYVRSREPEIVSTALRALGQRGDAAAIPELRKLLRGKPDARQVELVTCLHALQRTEPSWHVELLGMLRTSDRGKDPALRVILIDLLADVAHEPAIELVWQAFEHKAWTVRAAAYDYCQVVRDVRSVPLLIARLDPESGRLREDVLDVLMTLTAMRFNHSGYWQEWWKQNGPGFELVPAGAVQKHRPRSNEGSTVSYYGIPLVSDRVVFVVDVSGSMSANIGTDGARTRLDEAKRQLHRVVEGVPKHFLINVIPFHTTVTAVFEEMQVAVPAARTEALAQIDALRPLGGTNIHGALRRAFAESEVDTIYLLSDGSPSSGEITDPTALADEVANWNRSRRIRIHCIAIGTDSVMLKRISAESGGEYAVYR